ncbi:hypothetical protein KC19_4G051100 [Ceratodon purpureus]|uniref:Uncharacterized protein n=1 Tax=Ceratodon purpureus TaxID=3225 RepID=A0A8T0I8P1_CERPU|nr:hypothetical protein KC19_4G051100 [Ceratodon purpureus]
MMPEQFLTSVHLVAMLSFHLLRADELSRNHSYPLPKLAAYHKNWQNSDKTTTNSSRQ